MQLLRKLVFMFCINFPCAADEEKAGCYPVWVLCQFTDILENHSLLPSVCMSWGTPSCCCGRDRRVGAMDSHTGHYMVLDPSLLHSQLWKIDTGCSTQSRQ